MAVRILPRVSRIHIAPNSDRTEFRIHLHFAEGEEPDEMVLTFRPDELMALMAGLQGMQQRHSIPIPSNLRPHGKPTLTIVQGSDDDPAT